MFLLLQYTWYRTVIPFGALTINIKIQSTIILPDDYMDVNLGLSH